MAEIGRAVGRAPSTVAYQLAQMADRGQVAVGGHKWSARRYWAR